MVASKRRGPAPTDETMAKLQAAMEKAGVEFVHQCTQTRSAARRGEKLAPELAPDCAGL